MSLDLALRGEYVTETHSCIRCEHTHEHVARENLWEGNITHNLSRMFAEAGVYEILWRGDGLVAGEQVQKLEDALALMESDPERFRAFEAKNGWGTYEHAIRLLKEVIRAFEANPQGVIECSA